MTKTITISYNEADETLLLSFLKKLKAKTISPKAGSTITKELEPPPTKTEFLEDLRQSVADVDAHLRGEIELPGWEESLAQIKKELAEEDAQ